jgi:hypothetical protein
MNREQVYQQFLDYCRPYAPRGRWSGFKAPMDVWVPPANPSATLAALRLQFSDSRLLDAGVAIGGPGTSLMLSPKLSNQRAIILVLREKLGDLPFDLVVEPGCLSGNLPLRAAMRELRVRKSVHRTGCLALAFSITDLAVLRLVGIPAVPAGGLEDLHGGSLQWFCSLLGGQPSEADDQCPAGAGPHHGGSAGTHQKDQVIDGQAADTFAPVSPEHTPFDPPPELIFVAWSPSRLKLVEPKQLKDVLLYLAAAEKHLDIPLHDIYMWSPTQAELDRVAFCLQQGSRKDVHEAIMSSMDQSTRSIIERAPAGLAPKSLSEVTAHLLEVVERPFEAKGMENRAWAEYREKVNSDLVAPLLQLASTTVEPVQRSLMATVASIAQVLQPQAMLVSAKIAQQRTRGTAEKYDGIAEKDITLLLSMTDRLLKLNKELRLCKQNRKGQAKPARP